jgi:phytoene dehydrogenase-like protein
MGASDVVIVGAGLSGLCCALHLQEAGLSPLVLEAGSGIGGRLRTDRVDGFLLDRGLRALLTAGSEPRRILDLRALDLRSYDSGALVRFNGGLHRIHDPSRRRYPVLRTLLSPIGSHMDRIRLRELVREACQGSVERIFARPEAPTLEALGSMGFSEKMIDRFFRPFCGRVFMEQDLTTSSILLYFELRMLALGTAALPAEGIEAIPRQLADRLDEGTVRTGARVESVSAAGAKLDSGEEIPAQAVVVATEGPAAAALLDGIEEPPSCVVACLHYAADQAPVTKPLVVLNGDGTGPINDLCVPSVVSPTYAPDGKALVTASVIGHAEETDSVLERGVREQARTWFGPQVDGWRHLRTYRLAHALPAQPPPTLDRPERPVCIDRGIFVCGDHRDTATIQGALISGHRAAEAVMADLGRG